MNNQFVLPKKEYNNPIRQVRLGNAVIGGESSLHFMHSEAKSDNKPLTALEVLYNLPEKFPQTLKSAWGDSINDPVDWAKAAIDKGADALVIKFNLTESDNISDCQEKLKQIQEYTDIPLIILGSEKKEIDCSLFPALIETVNRTCTFGIVSEDNYKDIIPLLKGTTHNVIAKTPIDINLAKQLNILITEMEFDGNRIIIDPNTGALGYGLDYAYSIIERIKTAALEGDNMLNMPIISFAGEEAWKTKEAKSSNVEDGWGEITKRAIIWESLTASSILVAGANLVVMYHPESMLKVKKFINEA